MTARIIDGKALSDAIKAEVAQRVQQLQQQGVTLGSPSYLSAMTQLLKFMYVIRRRHAKRQAFFRV